MSEPAGAHPEAPVSIRTNFGSMNRRTLIFVDILLPFFALEFKTAFFQ